jgi:hypothetical protein
MSGSASFQKANKSLRRPQTFEHLDVAPIRDIRIMRRPCAGGRPLLQFETGIHPTERETRRQAAANRLLEIEQTHVATTAPQTRNMRLYSKLARFWNSLHIT